jgi:hypothetical protein
LTAAAGKMISWDDAFNSTRILTPGHLEWKDTVPTLSDADGYYPKSVPEVTNVLTQLISDISLTYRDDYGSNFKNVNNK